MTPCPLCGGAGGWEDPIAQQTIVCHLCRPDEAEAHALQLAGDGWATSRWPSMPARYAEGPSFQADPWLLVVHSGARYPNVAEFFAKTGYVVYKGRRIKVNAHLNWSTTVDGYAQSVPLCTVGKHCGGSRYKGNRRLNFCSIGMELPPNPDERQRDLTYNTVVDLMELVPSLGVAVAHRDIDGAKRDPLGYNLADLRGTGLELPFA